jgi:hypothetical protein
MTDASVICEVLQRELGEAALTRCQTSGVLFDYDHDAIRGGDQESLENHKGLLGSLIKICPTLHITMSILKTALILLDDSTGKKLSKGKADWSATEGYKLKCMCMLLKK